MEERIYKVNLKMREEIPEEIKVFRKYVTSHFNYRWSKDYKLFKLKSIRKRRNHHWYLEAVYELSK